MILRLLSYNIRHGGAGRERPIAAVIRNTAPDVVVFQEATRPHVLAELARDTGIDVPVFHEMRRVMSDRRVGAIQIPYNPKTKDQRPET